MGIKNLIKLINRYAPDSITRRRIFDYQNKVLGIDANLMLYKMVYAIRRNGYDLKNNDIIVTHVHSMIQKLVAFKKYNIVPIFVFDGMPPAIKEQTLKDRKAFKTYMMQKYYKAVTQDEKKKYYYMKSDITMDEIDDIKKLISIYGYTYIDSVEEADSQLAYMSKVGQLDGIVTDDLDILVFGGKIVLKNFSVAKNKWIDEINLDKLLDKLGIKLEQLIDIGILLGCDYCPTVTGVGPIKSYHMIKDHKDLQNLVNKGIINLTIDWKHAKRYFLDPKVERDITYKKGGINKNKLIDFLKEKQYDDKKIEEILKR